MRVFARGKTRQAFVDGDTETGSIMSGQVIGVINDSPSCKELIEEIMDGGEAVMKSLFTGLK